MQQLPYQALLEDCVNVISNLYYFLIMLMTIKWLQEERNICQKLIMFHLKKKKFKIFSFVQLHKNSIVMYCTTYSVLTTKLLKKDLI